jgi:arylsulfatase A-like enzyme
MGAPPCLRTATLLAEAITALHIVSARPNIILFFPDELRYDWVNNGTETDFLHTPHIDSIRKRGVKFNRAITASPICGPSRACFAAASHYEEVGVLSNQFNFPTNRLTTYYKLLRENGYHTMAVGKVDLNKKDTLASFGWGHDGALHADEFGFSRLVNTIGVYESAFLKAPDANGSYAEPYTDFLLQRNKTDEFLQDVRTRVNISQPFNGDFDYRQTSPNTLSDDLYNDNWVADQAVRLLHEAQSDPTIHEWFIAVNWNGPHYPMSVTQSMWNSVQGRTFPQPIDYVGPLDAHQHNRTRGDYAAMIENLDRQIGRILSTVEDLNNTVIVLASDHGEMLGDRGYWKKSVPYKASVQVPLVIAGDAVVAESRRGTTSDAGVSLIDLAATFLDIGDVHNLPAQMSEAVSLKPILAGENPPRRVVRSALDSWHLWFDGRFKYVSGFNNEATLLDLDTDPFERTNLLHEQNHVRLAHYERIVQWLLGKGQAVQDEVPLVERRIDAEGDSS